MAPSTDRRLKQRDPKIVLDVDAAQEVADLIADKPGTADEDLLDDALIALEQAEPRIASEDQDRARHGEAIAMELPPEAVEAVETLIESDEMTRPRVLRRVRDRLQGKLRQARERRSRRVAHR